ncbi:MAG: Rieske 2Fe-2S domain-containing protein [Nitrospirae bacterium]|nr:Rieske 2Fe-2S domain-containing protein [Nitrospirota bacterium]
MNSGTQEKEGVTRRDFLSTASFGMVVLSALALFGGMFRMSKPNVRYEEATKFKIGKAENFPVGTVKKLDEKGVFIFSTDEGLHAISSVCTHLGCIVSVSETGFQCPCHGSQYDENGKVIGGPAPRNLAWLEISRSMDGSLMVDTASAVPAGTTLKLIA